VRETALIECDFCSDKVQEAWYVGHGAFQFAIVVDSKADCVNIEAGKMSACPTCWGLVQAKNLKGLIDHYFERHSDVRGAQKMVLKEYVRAYHGGVLERLTGEVEYVTWASFKPQSPRFYIYKCRDCGEAMQIDGASYDRSIGMKCPRCGRDVAIIGRPDLAGKAARS
jgi:DNA-directed RNA polymerase subunit RPC12/RpoP